MKINERIKELVGDALIKESGYFYRISVENNNDCTQLECHVITESSEGWKANDWLYDNTQKITKIINKATSMIWTAPIIPGRDIWTLGKGCVHWHKFTGHPTGDGSDGDDLDEFLDFEDGEFQKYVGFVNGEKTDGIDISSYVGEDDFEFCEEPIV